MQREYEHLIFSWFCLTVRGPQKRLENVYAFHYKWRIKLGLRLIKILWELNVLMLLSIYGSVKQKKIIDKSKNNRQFAHNTISSGALIYWYAKFSLLSSSCHKLIFHGAQLIIRWDQTLFGATLVIMSDCLPGCYVNFKLSVEIFSGEHKHIHDRNSWSYTAATEQFFPML